MSIAGASLVGRVGDPQWRESFSSAGVGVKLGLVTGASGGIGRAIALALAANGTRVCAIGRDANRLATTVSMAGPSSEMTGVQADLTQDDSLKPLLNHFSNVGKLDVLVHCAGVIHQDRMGDACVEDFDKQYVINVRAPYLLTKSLLPMLVAAKGQIVFVNSSAGLNARRPDVGAYAASKHALRAIADSLREEVNPKGVRVLSVYLGRTATAMQETLFREEKKEYSPEMLLQPEDVASVIIHTLTLPRSAEVTDINMRPMHKSY
jgi:NADP-dependent 3-hydroxy acid dehydrogenase YdfG